MEDFQFIDFAGFISAYLPGKIQKITVNAGLTCPNRDGSKGTGGCIYCNNMSFSPGYTATHLPVATQLAKGKEFFARKYPAMKYLAYFQSYTSTHGDIDTILDMYSEALNVPDILGLVIGTRPDCMPQRLLNALAEINRDRFVMIEYGAESANDSTLQLINRCHSWSDTADAVRRTATAGIPVGLHLIMGLPGENRADMLHTIDEVNDLPVDIIKCHQLQLIRGTRLASDVQNGTIQISHFTVEEYIDLCCDIIQRLRPGIAIERFVSQSPDNLLISPRWGLKNYQFTDLLRKRLRQRGISHQ